MPLNNETGALDENSAEGGKAPTMEVRNRGTPNNAEKSPKLPKVCTPIRAIYAGIHSKLRWHASYFSGDDGRPVINRSLMGLSIDLTSHI